MFENNYNGKISEWLQIIVILIDILSCDNISWYTIDILSCDNIPWALLGSNVFIIANI